ncbi:carbon-nitrogen hydrolase family protein [Streptomyces sp. XD-27]|uniref:carbon-nitrogen hydrolase family protein n=1 Tax=Streptomyces sp. XD-27 TaxID=3062779 RepID=UPI0026F44C82|nr:carbon-nitrogen hydrolase family protein [Streptomyces sp. XD-27]WKX73829.1 carbon-nitrogen hydrolase family protein [Streptomyces sp. XD-27]
MIERLDDSLPLPSRPLRVAAAQAQAAAGDIPANAATVARMVREAADDGVRVVVFPEKFLTGYEPELIRADPARYAVPADGGRDARLDPVAEACRDTGTVAVAGAAVHRAGDLYVSALAFGPDGALAARYDKQTLFKTEREVYREGASGCTLVVDDWRLGLGICYDSGFPEHARSAALDGCHAYLVGALFSVGNGYHESRVWFPARAFDNTLYAVLANHIGTPGGWNTCGSSAIWGPDGRTVAEAGPDKPELVAATLHPEQLRAAREAEPMLRDLRQEMASASRTVHRLA